MSAIERIRVLASRKRIMAAFGLLSLAGVALAADLAPADQQVANLLKTRLPKTQVTKINCEKVGSLCEVTAGSNLFYVDRGGRYLVIGRVYDMQTRQDLTAARLLEINPDMLVGGAAKANASGSSEADDQPPVSRVQKVSLPAAPQRLSLDGLPKEGAIVWGSATGKPVTIFTDFRCGYCRALTNALRNMDVRVIERPISTLGSRDLADQVYCAKNREEALHAAYAGEPLKPAEPCDTSGLDANEKFAHQHGLTGTPVIVRADGAMIEGYRPKDVLEAWIKGARS